MSFSDYEGEFEIFDVEEMEHETDKAWLLVIDGDKYWLPKSACEYDGANGTVYVPEWLAKKKNLM